MKISLRKLACVIALLGLTFFAPGPRLLALDDFEEDGFDCAANNGPGQWAAECASFCTNQGYAFGWAVDCVNTVLYCRCNNVIE